MKLLSNPISPYSRKAMVIVHELGMKVEFVTMSPPFGTPEHRRINPLGKIPALILDDGSAIFDSPVICEYLNDLGGGKFFPGNSLLRGDKGKWKALTLQALGDGLADAAVAMMGEKRQPAPNQAHLDRYQAAMSAALDALDHVKFAEHPTIGEISAACAIGYIEFRQLDPEWRASRPNLSAWYDKFCDYPSMKATQPK